ncbi:tripartite tricarboxylate transporter TctB family protein [Alkalihalophilus lindianensis]|uniref:Tripartite tricarboxylate transporter TctB family protein n=1 Tax=Alkalihalophilus lindianensis TaxID=1630542 RepID=A0ABU3XA05_9BACI|nr:tripartite tricarboxylate transporter TctB family protein [Alkalihalophilus lindianensis]MDV2684452.1 tripartite tricarboxylate transporter TctB family protein [Alkalihalophilus lindianensis]
MIKKDRLTSIVLLLVCAFFYFESNSIRTSNLSAGLGATFFPRFLLGFIAILAVVMFINTFTRAAKAKDMKENENKPDEKSPLIVWVIFGIFGVYILLINFLGFILSSALFMFSIYLLLTWKKRTTKQHVLSFGGMFVTAFVLFFIFEKLLQVYLPRGIF